MARYSKIDGNYVLAVTDGGEIKLDVGPNSGGGIVRITGDLVVDYKLKIGLLLLIKQHLQ